MELRCGKKIIIDIKSNVNNKRKNEEMLENEIKKKVKIEKNDKPIIKQKRKYVKKKKNILKNPKKYVPIRKKEKELNYTKQLKQDKQNDIDIKKILEVAKQRFENYLKTLDLSQMLDVEVSIYEFLYCKYIHYNEDEALNKMLEIECRLNPMTGFLNYDPKIKYYVPIARC